MCSPPGERAHPSAVKSDFLISQANVETMAHVENKALPVEEVEDDDDYEDDDELEEGEIVVSDIDEDDEEGFDEDEAGLGDIADIAASLLATPDGDTVASALVGIREQLETQNRILIKIFSALKD